MKYSNKTPFVLSIVGAFGVVLTAYLTARATPKAIEAASKSDCDILPGEFIHAPLDNKIKMVKAMAPAYIPAFACGLSTIACIFGSNFMSRKQQASLASAYVMLEQSYKDYKRRVKELIGDDGEMKIKSDIAKEKYVPNHFDPGPGEQLFFDYITGIYFESSFLAVVDAEYQINRLLVTNGEVSLDEYCDAFGIDPPKMKIPCGWSVSSMDEMGIFWIDFEHDLVQMEDGLQCYIISPMTNPSSSFRD